MIRFLQWVTVLTPLVVATLVGARWTSNPKRHATLCLGVTAGVVGSALTGLAWSYRNSKNSKPPGGNSECVKVARAAHPILLKSC